MGLDLSKEGSYIQFSRDLFVFSYLCSGINFTDIANLKPSNIIEGRLIYIRQKTNKKINIPLSNESVTIIGKNGRYPPTKNGHTRSLFVVSHVLQK